MARAAEGLPKLWLIQRALRLRAAHDGAFGREGGYRPLAAEGPRADRVVAFERGGAVITVVPRLTLTADWKHTVLTLPEGSWRNVLGQDAHTGTVPIARLLGSFPVALLERAA